MKKIFFVFLLSIIVPGVARADMPDFPMSFYGAVTINGAQAAVGTVVRAYYGNTLAGEVTVTQAGIYGSAGSTAQKLLVATGTGAITFKVTAAAINGGVETAGNTALTYSGFVEDGSVSLDLPFTFTTTSAPESSSRRAGGGGGSNAVSKAVVNTQVGGAGVPTFSTADVARIKAMDVTELISFIMSLLNTQPTAPIATTQTVVVNPSTTIKSVPTTVVKQVSLATGFGAGATSPDVQSVQRYLNMNGYTVTESGPGSRGQESNYFGGLTKNALMKFQKDKGLPITGYFGPLTRQAMFGDF